VTPKRTDDIKPFLAMDVLEEAQNLQRQGESIIRLEVGEPDFPTPRCVIDAVHDALDRGMTHYTTSFGLLELREAICKDYADTYGVKIEPDQIVVTEGTSPALLLIFAALLEQGDHVLLSDPYYACYPNIINFFGGISDFFPVREEEGFLYDIHAVKQNISADTRAILINSPSNPTGKVQSGEVLQSISQLGPYIISDEIYHGLSYGVKEHSILEYTDKAFVLNGFSKRYAMTGWRLGYAIMPKEFIRPIQKLQQNFFICANAFVQWAGLIALQQAKPETEKMRQIYEKRLEYIVPALREAGFKIGYEPDGAYYILVNVKEFTGDSMAFGNRILHEAGVALTPGIDFGRGIEGYLRISYANSLENLQEGVERLKRFLERLK
jgi:aspartate/methionine/tyrosine aminotransferase